uniref:Uncharacterized protein n=1 Tax=Glossina palpalis gambiensis TaxID=67801 RepID=A0A1B0AZJ5_9MUSC
MPSPLSRIETDTRSNAIRSSIQAINAVSYNSCTTEQIDRKRDIWTLIPCVGGRIARVWSETKMMDAGFVVLADISKLLLKIDCIADRFILNSIPDTGTFCDKEKCTSPVPAGIFFIKTPTSDDVEIIDVLSANLIQSSLVLLTSLQSPALLIIEMLDDIDGIGGSALPKAIAAALATVLCLSSDATPISISKGTSSLISLNSSSGSLLLGKELEGIRSSSKK